MNGFTKFFTFIFEQGTKNNRIKKEIDLYVRKHSIWQNREELEQTVKQFHKYIYKKNGEYRKGGEELYNYIVQCYVPSYYL
jgi:hypothetical protein